MSGRDETLEEQLAKRIEQAERAGYERARKQLEEREEREVKALREELATLRRQHDVRDRRLNELVAGRTMRIAFFGKRDWTDPPLETLTLVFLLPGDGGEQQICIAARDLVLDDGFGGAL